MSARDPPVLVGFGQGLVAPLLELIASVLISTSLKTAETINASSSMYMYAITGIVILIDFVRNILLGLSRSEFALGNLIGNIIGIIIFYAAIASISQEAATQSILLTITLGVSYAVGLYLYLKD